MTISRAQMLRQLEKGLNALYGLEYKQYAPEHTMVFDTENSDQAFEEETKLSGFGMAVEKREGEGIQYDEAQEAYTSRYTHQTIALGFSITEEAMEDNLYAKVGARYTKALARSMAHTKQVRAAAVLNNGFSGSYLGGDGQPLFSASHPLTGGGVNSNLAAVASDLNETALEAACIQIGGWTDERGLLINASVKRMIVPRQLMFVAERLLKTPGRVETADNDINAIKNLGVVPGGYAVNNYLTDPDAWFLKTDIPNGLKHFTRVAMKTGMEGDFDTGNVRYKARERYSFGWSDHLGVWGTPGA